MASDNKEAFFTGSFTALVTPFTLSGDIDWAAYDTLVERQIENGTHGLVPCGTTGESPTLTHAEHMKLVERCVEVSNKRIPVMAGTGSNSTREAEEFTKHAKSVGADAALVVTPYYNKPTQEGLYAHYKHLNDECRMPIYIYNIPGRSVINMEHETMIRLASLPYIVGVKDATGDLSRVKMVQNDLGDSFSQLSGEDAIIDQFLEQGGHGCISVTSNIYPDVCANLHNAWAAGDKELTRQLNEALQPVHNALFCETSPQPAKYALSRMGLCTDNLRLPLVPASQAARDMVDNAMQMMETEMQISCPPAPKAATA
jgi:4-hydroxy-tetrahydrodipicolinate synthase